MMADMPGGNDGELIGRTIGRYEVLEKIGAGGMGVVYRAHDSRLDRQVAIKTLPEEVSRDRERLHRLEREAKTLASLNHSGIGAIYDLEEEGEQRFLVLELVAGETLAERLEGAPWRSTKPPWTPNIPTSQSTSTTWRRC